MEMFEAVHARHMHRGVISFGKGKRNYQVVRYYVRQFEPRPVPAKAQPRNSPTRDTMVNNSCEISGSLCFFRAPEAS